MEHPREVGEELLALGRVADEGAAQLGDGVRPRRKVAILCSGGVNAGFIEFQQYLDAINKKGAIFRDIIIENEYDPLESNRKDIRVRTAKLEDPTSRVLDKAAEERGMVQGVGSPQQTGGRYTLEVPHWATGKIEATPHGFFAKMTTETKQLDERMKKLTGSTVMFDHFDAPSGNLVAAAEFPLGKKCEGFD